MRSLEKLDKNLKKTINDIYFTRTYLLSKEVNFLESSYPLYLNSERIYLDFLLKEVLAIVPEGFGCKIPENHKDLLDPLICRKYMEVKRRFLKGIRKFQEPVLVE